MPVRKSPACSWISEHEAFRAFATHTEGTQSAGHIKPLHWYVACRLVVEGGFDPSYITPRPPFEFRSVTRKGKRLVLLTHRPDLGGNSEQTILGGLKTKDVDIVVSLPTIGPVLAVSCKGMTGAFRNLTNRMEETIGECTNLHITYPAMVIGYFALLRANRTPSDVEEAPSLEPEDEVSGTDSEDELVSEDPQVEEDEAPIDPVAQAMLKPNDLAFNADGRVTESIVRFEAALREMTGRRGIRDEISRYEAMTIALVEPRGDEAGSAFETFPDEQSPLHLSAFFATLYQRYEERFVYGAPSLAKLTGRYRWSPESPAFAEAESRPEIAYKPRLSE